MRGRSFAAFTCACSVVALGSACGLRQPRRGSADRGYPELRRQAPVSRPASLPARIAAIGDTGSLAPELRRAFDPAGFEAMPAPGPDDWLAHHAEKPQSFADYVRAGSNVPDPQRKVIYLLPLGSLPASAPPLSRLADVVHAFFALQVRILPAVKVSEVAARTRINEMTGKRQLFAPEVIGWLRTRLPDDAFALLALTAEDLYPDPTWNFVFGQASLKERVGVQSLARQDPAFFGEPRARGWEALAHRRAAWTLLHEISHMFGLTHCTYWRCVVAGSNSQEETDRSPLHPCPVCLRKLAWALRFDPAAREDALSAAFRQLGIGDEAAWSAARAAWIRNGVVSNR